jgi:hypothetical protein
MSNQTMKQEETPINTPTITWVVELPIFLFLACVAHPFAVVPPDRGAEVFLCLVAWFILSLRYSIWELCTHLARPTGGILRWVYFGAPIFMWQLVIVSESNLLRPARYSVYYYQYGVEVDYDDEGGTSASASHEICKGPYRFNGRHGNDGSDEVPEEVDGDPLEGKSREDFFYWEASGTEEAKGTVLLPIRCLYHLLNEFVRYTLPKFILMCLLFSALSFHHKTRISLRFLVAALVEYRRRPTSHRTPSNLQNHNE